MSEEKQTLREIKQLKAFCNSSIGRWWWLDNKVLKLPPKSKKGPDFIFNTNDGLQIGFEITEFYAKNQNKYATQALTNIGNKVCEYIKKEYGIQISMLIDYWDPRKWSSNPVEHMDYIYNPGFSKLPDQKKLLQMVQADISNNVILLKQGQFLSRGIQIEGEYFKICVEAAPWNLEHEYGCRVNNEGRCAQEPIDELQAQIDNKDGKLKSYKEFCDNCYLLVVIPTSKDGNFCYFSEKLKTHKFKSNYKAVFVYDEFSHDVVMLKTVKKN